MTKLRKFDPARYLTDDEAITSFVAVAGADALVPVLGGVTRDAKQAAEAPGLEDMPGTSPSQSFSR